MRDDDSSDPGAERARLESIARRHDRTEAVEDALGHVGGLLQEAKYPVTAEELSAEYGDEVLHLPNETESLGSVFDRLVDERFESGDEARQPVYHELTGRAAGPDEYHGQRAVDELDGEELRLLSGPP